MSNSQELAAMTAHLRDYILDGEVYKTISVTGDSGDDLIKMTIGGMVERIVEQAGSAEANAAQSALDREQQSQPDAFWGLVAREAKSYADSWKWYLQRVAEGDEQAIQDYAQEVPIRQRLERLLTLGEGQPALSDAKRRTAELDRKLQGMWRSGSAGGSDAQWWLHGQPVAPEAD